MAHLGGEPVVDGASDQAVHLGADRLMSAARRERKPDARVVIERQADGGTRARHHVAIDLAHQPFTAVVHLLRTIRGEQA